MCLSERAAADESVDVSAFTVETTADGPFPTEWPEDTLTLRQAGEVPATLNLDAAGSDDEGNFGDDGLSENGGDDGEGNFGQAAEREDAPRLRATSN